MKIGTRKSRTRRLLVRLIGYTISVIRPPIKLMDFIRSLEEACGKEAVKEYLPMQPGDVYQTNADTTRLYQEMDYKPRTPLKEGVEKFVRWYKSIINKFGDGKMPLGCGCDFHD